MNDSSFDAKKFLGTMLPEGIGVHAAGKVHTGRGETIEIRDPATGTLLAQWQDPGAEGAHASVEVAVAAAEAWAQTNPFDRARVLRAISASILEEADDLAVLETITTGKPLRDARGEVARVAEMFAYYSGWADKITGQTIPVPGQWVTYTRRVPLGVVVAVTPWNAPLFTAGWNAAPALAAGNAVIVKPSEFTPATTLRLATLAERAGLPPGVLTVAAGLGTTVGATLTADPRIGKIAFIGSVATGHRVAATAAAAGTPALLELGGKSANVVFADADLDTAANGALAAVFAAAGQSCVAGSRLLVHHDVHDELLDRVAAGAATLRVGNPLDPDTEIGPINNRPQYERVRHLVDQGIADGAELRVGGAVPDIAEDPRFRDGNWIAPTVLARVEPTHRLEHTEVFGPVLAVGTFGDEAEAVRRANGTPFGLAGAVWTRDVSRAHRVADAMRAGTFWINSYKMIHVAAPFGGFGASGWGRSSGPDVLFEYTEPKTVWVPTAATEAPFPSLAQ